jgi:hypothetical protein
MDKNSKFTSKLLVVDGHKSRQEPRLHNQVYSHSLVLIHDEKQIDE